MKDAYEIISIVDGDSFEKIEQYIDELIRRNPKTVTLDIVFEPNIPESIQIADDYKERFLELLKEKLPDLKNFGIIINKLNVHDLINNEADNYTKTA